MNYFTVRETFWWIKKNITWECWRFRKYKPAELTEKQIFLSTWIKEHK